MKPFVWQEGMSEEESKNGAYWERNMLALMLAKTMIEAGSHIDAHKRNGINFYGKSGWYVHGAWEGWSRVISIDDGRYTFHIPDDFDVGDLPKIEPNWDGHTTLEKWQRVMDECGCDLGSDG